MHEQNKTLDQKISTIDERVDNLEFALVQTQSQITDIRKDEVKKGRIVICTLAKHAKQFDLREHQGT